MKRLLFLILILSHIIPLSAQQLTEEQIKQKVNQTASAMKTNAGNTLHPIHTPSF